MSGQSRGLWRAKDNEAPYVETSDTRNSWDWAADYTDAKNASGMAGSGRFVINNDRRENYVSGLQYAVEQASELNRTNGN
ncbi:MAG: hypothetical protein IJ680_04525 [Paludibacteraceae bacterium]|nr:hypothetical protein [Paludibacteraceae bacterium]